MEEQLSKIRSTFHQYFEDEDKKSAVMYCLDLLKNQEVDILDLYSGVLTKELNEMTCKLDNHQICIWQEHVKTAIVRTIVECAYPYVEAKKEELNYPERGKAVVLCPPEEYHDLGARMVADYLTVLGFETIFVGSNTPYQDFLNAVDVIKPELIAISVSNYYNLVVTKKVIAEIKGKLKSECQILVGGNAFHGSSDICKTIGADCCCATMEDIKKWVLKGGEA